MAHWRRGGGHADTNQPDLLKLAERLGATYKVVSQVGEFVDAVLGFRGQNLLWEVKKPGWKAAVARGKKLTKTEQTQLDLRRTWCGRKPEIIETANDVLRSLLSADLAKPLDYADIPDDFFRAIVNAARSADVLTAKGGRR